MDAPVSANTPTIRDLYPELADDDLVGAEDSLNRYVAVTLGIYERVRQDPKAHARFRGLTDSRHES
jgi:hypothetical protein